MFGIYFGEFLKSKGIISDVQYKDIIDKCQNSRVKLGLLATESGLMSAEQAEEVNTLQKQLDKRFGDIAVEKGYLTDGQVSFLLKQQGDGYLLFVQSLDEAGIMKMDDVQRELNSYAAENGFTEDDIEEIKSSHVDREVKVFLNKADIEDFYKEYIALTARFIVRFVDPNVRIGFVKKVNSYEADFMSKQGFEGDKPFTVSFAANGDGKALRLVAESLLKEPFDTVDLDVLDANCEFINMNNGLFATDQHESGISIDMLPPEMKETKEKIEGNMLVVPMYIKGNLLELVIEI